MHSAAEVVASLTLPSPVSARASTGFEDLDFATGGLRPGDLWVITGAHRHGRSTLALQWALSQAQHGALTHLYSRDPAHTAQRLLARLVTDTTVSLRRHGRTHARAARFDTADNTLAELPLRLGSPSSLASLANAPEHPFLPAALVVDDAHRDGNAAPDRLRALADRGALVIATAPIHVVGQPRGGLDPNWAEAADVIAELERPDLYDPLSTRPGEVDLRVISNVRGPDPVVVLDFQTHYHRMLPKNVVKAVP